MDLRIRAVPTDVHQALKSKAALEGKTLNDYVRDHLRKIAVRAPRQGVSK